MSNAANGVVHVDRRGPNTVLRRDASLAGGTKPRSEANSALAPSPAHDAGLVMPHWTSSFESGGSQYAFSVIGTNPSQGGTTTIQTVIVPYRLVMPDGGIFDASTDLIDGVTPVAGVVNSPLFKSVPWSAGNTSLGVTQWGDAVMRANFWSLIHGDRSDYHVLLSQPVVLPVQVIEVPSGFGITTVDSRGTRLGVVDLGWLTDTTTNLTVALNLPPQVLSIHLVSAVETADLNGGGSLGYHFETFGGTAASPVIQPYIQTGYFSVASAQAFDANTKVLAHEIAEFLNDPAGDNFVPAWQDPRLAHVCDNPFMEVADPLESTLPGLQVTLNGESYLFPEVAFQPWFTREPSTSVNGWYSLLNTFHTPSAACPVYENFGYGYVSFNGTTSTQLTGVNNGAGNTMQVTGYVTQTPNAIAGFMLDFTYNPNLTFTNVTSVYVPGSAATIPIKINNRGQMVGIYYDSKNAVHGFLFSKGQYSSIDFPGAVATEALGINNWDVPAIVGDYTDTKGTVHGFLFLSGLFLPVNAGFAANLSVRGINDFAQITGAYDLGGALGTAPTYGFTGIPGFLTPLQFPGDANTSTVFAAYTVPNSLNNLNVVAGQVQVPLPYVFQEMPFLEGGGNFQPFEGGDLFTAAAALGNNDAGVLVGWLQNPDLGTLGGVVFPLPETGVTRGASLVQLPLTIDLHSLHD